MRLTPEEEGILRGERGEAVEEALRVQLEVGEFFGAQGFVGVSNVHMMGDIEVMGDGGLEFLRRVAGLGARCMVNTTTNARCFDFDYVERLNQDKETAEKEKELISLLQEIGVMTTDTCINYQSLYQPHLGEHVAWGDTGTVIYANSVLGARSNFESGPVALAAALTGRTPAYGFHLDERRKGKILVELEAEPKNLADWGAVGKLVGEKHQNYFSVPVFTGVEGSPIADDLKHLGASLASYDTGDSSADLVVFSGPQLSLYELKTISELLEGKKVKEGTSLIVTTNRGYKAAGEKLGYLHKIEEAGGMVLEGVCFYILDSIVRLRVENGWDNLVTNSAKLANIIAAHKFNPILRRTEECVEAALTGRVEQP